MYEKNFEYWSHGYNAPNVESFMFRFYGRILKHDFGIDGSRQEKVFDFGCGQGAALNYFLKLGFRVYGVDISERDLYVAKVNAKLIDNKNENSFFEQVPPKPMENQKYFEGLNLGHEWIDIAISIQTLDFLNRTDCQTVVKNIHDQMKPGGIFFASFNGTSHYYFKNSTEVPNGDGLRHVKFKNDRIECDFLNCFCETKEEMAEKFSIFKPLYIDYYDSSFRNEGSEFRWTFCGVKQ